MHFMRFLYDELAGIFAIIHSDRLLLHYTLQCNHEDSDSPCLASIFHHNTYTAYYYIYMKFLTHSIKFFLAIHSTYLFCRYFINEPVYLNSGPLLVPEQYLPLCVFVSWKLHHFPLINCSFLYCFYNRQRFASVLLNLQ